MASNKDLSNRLTDLEKKVDKQFAIVFKVFDDLMRPAIDKDRKRIGYKIGSKEDDSNPATT